MAFVIEDIPDEDLLYRRIHGKHYHRDIDKISSVAFKDERMSVNWAKHSSPEAAAIATSVLVVSLVAGECRQISQKVEHTPIEAGQIGGPNQSHAEVYGSKKTAKDQLRDMARVVWRREDAAGAAPIQQPS